MLLEIAGKSSRSFINGLVPTNLQKVVNTNGVYSMFLDYKGKILTDVVLYPLLNDSMLLEVHESNGDMLKDYLDLHNLHGSVEVSTPDLRSTSLKLLNFKRQDLSSLYNKLSNNVDVQGVFVDMRLKAKPNNLYLHLITNGKVSIPDCVGGFEYSTDSASILSDYIDSTVFNGCIKPKMFYCNELLSNDSTVLSIDKGCYVGQEYVMRLKSKQLVQKRHLTRVKLSTQISSDYNDVYGFKVFDSPFTGQTKSLVKAGTLLESVENNGLALIDLNTKDWYIDAHGTKVKVNNNY